MNVLIAGVVSPLLWDHPRWLALGMVALMLLGLGCWLGFMRSVRGRPLRPPTVMP